MELVSIHQDSPVFSRLEYDLQSLSKISTLKITKAFDVSNPNLTVQFERASKDLLVLNSWIDADTLQSPNKELDTIRKGFQCGPQGMEFPVGSLSQLSDGNKRLMCCKLAVGRSFCIQDRILASQTLPEGYNSYYLDPEQSSSLDSLDFCKEDRDPFQSIHYILKDTAQILPCFVVELQMDKSLERYSRKRVFCDNCENEEAQVYCLSDQAHFCSQCNDRAHSTRVTSRHSRLSLEEGAKRNATCRAHPLRKAEFFCPACHQLVCLDCKMVGHHSTGEAARHPLVSVLDAYQSIVEESSTPNLVVEERRAMLKAHLQKIEAKGLSILEERTKIKETLFSLYKKALDELDEIVEKKLLILKGDSYEYKRQLYDIDRCRDYMMYLKDGRDSTVYLLSWHHYLHAKNSLALLPFRSVHPNGLDLQVVGSLAVASKSSSEEQPSSFALSLVSSSPKSDVSLRKRPSSLYKFGYWSESTPISVGNAE